MIKRLGVSVLRLAGLLVAVSFTISCSNTVSFGQNDDKAEDAASLLPVDNRVLLIIGQDRTSVSSYVGSGLFPTPGGITTYLSLYNLLDSAFPAYGALGQDVDGEATGKDVDWGAGPLNAYRSAVDYPDSALVIGLSIAEGSGDVVWRDGGLADIFVGAYDAQIRRLARFCKTIEKPVYLRIGYEFDGHWNRGYEKTTSYKLAYRRIVDIMREQGVTNVAYVWQASASPYDDKIEGRRENIADWYPGDEYVDWLALSWFRSPDEKHADVATQRELADEVLQYARARHKPVMIAEAAPQGYDIDEQTQSYVSVLWDGVAGSGSKKVSSSEIWHQWFAPLLQYVHDNSDVVRAMAYINADWDSQTMWASPYNNGYWGDSRIEIDSVISERWLQEIDNRSFWQHGESTLRHQLLRQ